MKEALFYQKLPIIKPKDGAKVKCNLCHHFCQISLNKRGLCGVRENRDGALYSLVYGKVIAANIDPIEKKPLFHFLPGTRSFSIATVGCNFRCANCQNADISQASKEGVFFQHKEIPGKDMTPEEVVKQAISSDCQSIAYTYTEPTMFFEFALDCMKLAKDEGLANVLISNGYTGREALEAAKPYLDAVNIDLKFFTDKMYKKICGAKLQPILDNLIWYKQNDIWTEVTTLIIPKLNDSEQEITAIARFIKDNLGQETPWHLSGFFPTYRLNNAPPTPNTTIRHAWQIGRDIGLYYVYGGNVSDPLMESTYCPRCGEVAIERIGYTLKRMDKDGRCANCGSKINLII